MIIAGFASDIFEEVGPSHFVALGATTDPEIVDSEGTGYQTRVATDLALNQDQLDLISCILLLTFRT